MVVEDERLVAEDIKKTLEGLGYEVTSIASAGAQAISRAGNDLPDLVLMDIVLKGEMNGIEAASQIHSKYQIPIIYLTAYADEKTLERAKVTEPFGYIIKPFEDRELHSVIEMGLYKSQMDKRLERVNNLLRSLRNVNQLITKEKKRKKLIQGICDNLIKNHHYHYSWIILLNKDKSVKSYAAAGLGKEFKPMIKLLKSGNLPECVLEALELRDVIIRTDVAECGNCHLSKKFSGEGALTIRLGYGEEDYGVLCVSIPKGLIIDEEEFSLFSEVTEDIGFALYKIKLEAEHRRAQKELVRLSTAVKTSIDSIIISDADAKIIDVNEAALKMYGFENKEDMIGKNSLDFIAPEDRARAFESMDEVRERGYHDSREYNLVNNDGSIIPIEMTSTIMKEVDGKSIGQVGIVRDITERKQAEEAIKESEIRYRSFVENVPGIAFRTDVNHKPIFFHGAVEAITGYKEEQLVEGNRNWDRIIHPSDVPRFKKSIEKLFSNPANFIEEEFRIIHKNGQTRWVNGIIQYICDDSGKPISFQGTLYDITERKYAEEALIESEQRFRAIYNNANDGILLTDIETNRYYTGNDTICKMLGYTLDELQSLYVVDIHPNKDLPYVIDEFKKQINGELTLAKNIPICTKKGNIIYVDINSSDIVLAGKKYLMGVYRDVTERKRAEEVKRNLFKEKTRAELHGFIVSALPVFTASVTSQVRDTLVATFTDRFEETFRPKFNHQLGEVSNTKGLVEPEIMYEFYLNWISEFFSNLGVIIKIKSNCPDAHLEFINCPWKDDARGNPIFCLICRAMVTVSFNWTDLEGSVNQISSIAGESESCVFNFHLFNYPQNLEKKLKGVST